jgi:hypothetical protein
MNFFIYLYNGNKCFYPVADPVGDGMTEISRVCPEQLVGTFPPSAAYLLPGKSFLGV